MSNIVSYLNDENGASAAEYALILAVIGAAIAVAALSLGGSIKNVIQNASDCINTPTAANCP